MQGHKMLSAILKILRHRAGGTNLFLMKGGYQNKK